MYFLFALISTVGYSLQGTLLTSFYRKMDPLSAVAYRGLTLGVTMLPLLLLVSQKEFGEVDRIFPLLVCASFVTAIGNLFSARTLLYLPVGLATALTMTFSSIVALLIGVLFLGEGLTPTQILLSVVLLGTIVVLGASRSSTVTLESFDLRRGIEASLGFGLSLGTGFVLVAIASRKVSPFLAGYLWELLAGRFAA